MATYLILLNWTDQAIRNIKESPKRVDAAKQQVKELGGEVKAFYMLQGRYDMAVIVEVPDDEKLARFLLKIGSAGNARSLTLRAYSEEEYRKIIASLS